MKPTTFPEANMTWAEDQPEYLPLPACVEGNVSISCWELTFMERLRVLLKGRLWLSQMNFGKSLQPIRPSVSKSELFIDPQ